VPEEQDFEDGLGGGCSGMGSVGAVAAVASRVAVAKVQTVADDEFEADAAAGVAGLEAEPAVVDSGIEVGTVRPVRLGRGVYDVFPVL
jgi:hypothetical protein